MINYNNPKLHLAVISFVLYVLFALISKHFALLALLASTLLLIYGLIAKNSDIRGVLPSALAQNLDLVVPTVAGILWAISFWLAEGSHPVLLSIVFMSLVAAAIVCFHDELDTTSGFIITPMLSYCIYLLVVPENSYILLAIGTLLIAAMLFVAAHFKHLIPIQEETRKADQLPDQISNQLEEKDKYINKIHDLSEKNKQLEVDLSAAEMAKMEFLATMSHEIRTPLNGIVPLIDIVLDSELTEFQQDYLTTAHTSATQMQKLIDDLLDFSKVEAGKMRIELSGLKVNKIMQNVQTGLEGMAEKKGLEINISVDSNISPLLRGDPIRLRQILTNLLSNAIKFSHNGTIQLSATRLRNEGNYEFVRFSVKDEGIGIDPEDKDKLFNAFTQADNSSTRKFGGTGLGLAISKKIVELLKGTIGVDSEKGKGSTFWFELPLLKSAGETVPSEKKSADGYKAILINSNPELFKSIQQKLQNAQIKSHVALNLQQAMARLKSAMNIGDSNVQMVIFIDFDTNAKMFRQLLLMMQQDLLKDTRVCVISKQSQIAGVKQHKDIHIVNKDMSIAQFLEPFEAKPEEPTKPAQLLVKKKDQEEESKEPIPANERDIDTIDNAVLLVEDNEVNLKVAQKLIDYIGYPFDVAKNGMEGLEKAKERSYRMILMDCQMPIMDGYTCTKRIRSHEKENATGRTPIIAMTANAMLGDREKCIAAGMDDYMSKPLNRYILEKTLKKWDPLAELQKKKAPAIQAATDESTESTESTESIESTESTENTEQDRQQAPAAPRKRNTDSINSKWLSLESLEKIEEFMGEETDSLLELFKQESPTLLKQMQQNQAHKNFAEVQKIAHTLKSTSANIGANGLSFFCKKMEHAAMQQETESVKELLEKIKKAYLLTVREIKKYKNEA